MAAKVGRTIDVLVDAVDDKGATGRSKWDAPEIDGSVFLDGAMGLQPATSCKLPSPTPTNTTYGPMWLEA
jgi:ribosomal protein S12 methylthiotransferase